MSLYQFELCIKTKNVTVILLERDLRVSKLHRHMLPSKLGMESFSKFPTGTKITSMFDMETILHLQGESTEKVRKGQRWSRHTWL